VSTQVRVAVALRCLLLAGVVEDGGGVALEALELVFARVGSIAALGGATLVVGVAGAGTGLSVALVLWLRRLTALVGSRHLESYVKGLFDALVSCSPGQGASVSPYQVNNALGYARTAQVILEQRIDAFQRMLKGIGAVGK